MYQRSFLGGICTAGCGRSTFDLPSAEAVNEDWGWTSESSELFLRASVTARLFTWDGLAILIRGYVRSKSSSSLDVERVAEELRCHYFEHGDLAVDDLEGSFTLALCDSQSERVLLYRNLVGAGFTYYRPTSRGLLFSGNLAELVELDRRSAKLNENALPSFFLFRCIPGRETLFSGIFRLLPGELVSWDSRGLIRQQRHTFAGLISQPISPSCAIDIVEDTLSSVLADCHAHRPFSVNLLSGGVDSTYLQALWNQRLPADTLPLSYSISVDHPMTWIDTDYAVTASQSLGTQHKLVTASDSYLRYLTDTVQAAAEPLNHVQSAYFGRLAQVMASDGVSAGLCGEGADSLFGVGMANQIHNAQLVRRYLPGRPLRAAAAVIASSVGYSRLAATLRLSYQFEKYSCLNHPVNQVAVFTDLELVTRCFGRRAVGAAFAQRRELLEQYGVSRDPMDRLHATGYLGEAIDSAGLWASLFARAGVDLLCPFLDSRMLRLALNLPASVRYPFRKPKELLKAALSRHVPATLARRVKLGFGQPIFSWLAPAGQLRSAVETIGQHPFVDRTTFQTALQKPSWFLYSLLVYDTWNRLFLERSSSTCATFMPAQATDLAHLPT